MEEPLLLKWTDKYNITQLDKVIGQERVIEELKVFIKLKKPINIIFVGPPGSGKTMLAEIVAKLYLEANLPTDAEGYIHRYNSSDDRGLEFVRNEVKEVVGAEGIDVMLLDEGDYLTHDDKKGGAQAALRRLAEQGNSRGKIMIITANTIQGFIPAILSRFMIINVPRLADEDIANHMKYILDTEKIDYSSDLQKKFIGQVIINGDGDMRKVMNNLEWASLDNELVVNEGYVLYRENVDTYRSILTKIFDKGDFMGLKKDMVHLLHGKKYAMLPGQIIMVTDEWLDWRNALSTEELKKNKLKALRPDQYLGALRALKECDKVLAMSNTRKYIQIIGMLVEFRNIALS